MAPSHSEVVVKADALKFNATPFSYIPSIVAGVPVGVKDTRGPAIFSIRKRPARYAKPNVFRMPKLWTTSFHNHLVARGAISRGDGRGLCRVLSSKVRGGSRRHFQAFGRRLVYAVV